MIDLTRRNLLQSSAAVGFVACAPAIIPIIEKEKSVSESESVLSMVLKLIMKEQYPEDYHNPFLHQLGYAHGISDPGHSHGLRDDNGERWTEIRAMDISSRTLDAIMNTALITQYPNLFSLHDQLMNRLDVVRTRAMKTIYSLDLMEDFKVAPEALLKMFSAEFAIEFIHEKNRLANEGLKMCQYIPIQIVRAVSPYTFQPYFAAKTRYAVKAIGA